MSESIVMQITAPPWGELDTVLKHTGITKNWLLALVKDGQVRKRKRNGQTQGRAVYCIADVIDYLNKGE